MHDHALSKATRHTEIVQEPLFVRMANFYGSCPLLVKNELIGYFGSDEQAQNLRQIKPISSSIPKSGHEPFLSENRQVETSQADPSPVFRTRWLPPLDFYAEISSYES
jgi:hypothetical protein